VVRVSHFGARVDGKINLSNFTEVVEAVEVIEATKVSHTRKSISM
jgi:hypothetical protein